MNRRQWLKMGSGFTGSIIVAKDLDIELISKDYQGNEINEIHVLHLSHTDFGYTDLPSNVWKDQVEFIKVAMRYMDETAHYSVESRFKWTLENMWVLERFWNEASFEEREKFDKYVREGMIEVTAMPGNMTCLPGRYEWEKELERLSFFFNKYKPKVALQSDVNGLPSGLADSLLKHNVRYFIMGANGYYNGGTPTPQPSIFWWQAKNGQKILLSNGQGYANGYDYFHDTEWRHGPVPPKSDIWFNQPSRIDIFSSKKENVLRAHEILKKKLEGLKKAGYPHRVLQITTTNQLTIDNDYPARQLSDFIKQWNELRLHPKLILSTPSIFFKNLQKEVLSEQPIFKGEWCDWWADGIAASPMEVSVLQAAKRRNIDIGNALAYFAVSPPGTLRDIQKLNHDLLFCQEHTWGAYDSVARPYDERTIGNHFQKFEVFYRASENSKRIQADIIRRSKFYKPLSETKYIEVINPGVLPRSGWAEVSARALRIKATGVRSMPNGKFYPFDVVEGAEWVANDNTTPSANEIPNDVWPFFPAKNKFFIENVKPGERMRFELVENTGSVPILLQSSKYFAPVFDNQTNQINNIIFKPIDKLLFDNNSSELPGQIIIERPQGKFIRDAIAAKSVAREQLDYSKPVVINHVKVDCHYALRYHSLLEAPFAKRIEQQWDLFDIIPRIELTTTIWMKENLEPLAVYIAFPFAVKSPRIFYDSLGNSVEVGVDQMPRTCGNYSTVQNGVGYRGEDINLAISTPDTPMVIFDEISRGKIRQVFVPKTGHFFNMICQNYWTTNFAVLKPQKLIIRHIIECQSAANDVMPVENIEMWAYPSV